MSGLRTLLKYLAVLAILAFFGFPVVWTVLTSIKPLALIPQLPPAWLFTPTFEHYIAIFTENRLYFSPEIEAVPASKIPATGQTIAVNGGGITAALVTGNGVNMSQIAIVDGTIETGPARWIRKAGGSNPAPGPKRSAFTPSCAAFIDQKSCSFQRRTRR